MVTISVRLEFIERIVISLLGTLQWRLSCVPRTYFVSVMLNSMLVWNLWNESWLSQLHWFFQWYVTRGISANTSEWCERWDVGGALVSTIVEVWRIGGTLTSSMIVSVWNIGTTLRTALSELFGYDVHLCHGCECNHLLVCCCDVYVRLIRLWCCLYDPLCALGFFSQNILFQILHFVDFNLSLCTRDTAHVPILWWCLKRGITGNTTSLMTGLRDLSAT